VHRDPAALNRLFEPGAVLRRRGLQIEQHRPIDQRDVDPAVLNGFAPAGATVPFTRLGSGFPA
jgi:hypothetical protein